MCTYPETYHSQIQKILSRDNRNINKIAPMTFCVQNLIYSKPCCNICRARNRCQILLQKSKTNKEMEGWCLKCIRYLSRSLHSTSCTLIGQMCLNDQGAKSFMWTEWAVLKFWYAKKPMTEQKINESCENVQHLQITSTREMRVPLW